MKWVAVGLVVFGCLLIGLAWSWDATSSYNDGSFLTEMVIGIAGAIMVVSGILMLAGLALVGLQ